MAEDLDRGDDFVPVDDVLDNKGDDKAADIKADDKAADDAAAPAKKFEKKSDVQTIPKARVDAMVLAERTRAETAERRAAELEKAAAAVTKDVDAKKIEEEITALEKQHSKAMLDGNVDVAAELAGKIRLKERQIQIELSKGMSSQAKEEAREDIRLDLVIERLEEQHPQLNENHDDFDQDLVDMVLATQRQMIEKNGMSPSQALTQATKKVMDKFAPPKSDAKDDDKDADKDDKETKTNGLDKAKVADRTKAQVDKNIDTITKQPVDTKGAGLDSDKKGITANVDVTKLSQTEFNALPEATKERLRGDTL